MARRLGAPPYNLDADVRRHFPKWDDVEIMAFKCLVMTFRNLDVAVPMQPRGWRIIYVREGRIKTIGSKKT